MMFFRCGSCFSEKTLEKFFGVGFFIGCSLWRLWNNSSLDFWPYMFSKTTLKTIPASFNYTFLVETKGPCSPVSFHYEGFF